DAFTVTAEALARKANVAIRASAMVEQILVKDDAVTGVVLDNGDEVSSPTVISTADPVSTLLGMVDPVWLDPEFLHAVRQIKLRGSTAFVMYALDSVPEITGLADPKASLASMVTLTPTTEALERSYDATKYGQVSEHPHVEFTIPSLRWPRLAPEGKHVLVARAQYAPYALADGATWDGPRSSLLADCVTSVIARVIPRFASHILGCTV